MSTANSLGAVLSALMKKFELSAPELERLTGVPASTTYRLLKDKQGNPTFEVLKKLASFFQITVSQLIGEEPIGNKQIPVIPSKEILSYLKMTNEEKAKYPTIPVDFPLNNKCFATTANDGLMEPFILQGSLIIIDPEREISNKDFVIFIGAHSNEPQIRQIVKDGDELYLKILNDNYEIKITKMDNKQNYRFFAVIIHYRTNLFKFDKNEVISNIGNVVKEKNCN